MAEEVTVKLEVDADGAVKAVKGSGEAFEELSQSSMDADEAMERVGDSAVQAGQSVEKSAQDAADSTRKLANATTQAANAQVDMQRASGNATQILFSAGDAIQDVQFGFAGAANNIAFMAEQFATVQQQAGGTTNALKAIATSLTGAGGVILGFQALLVVAPKIIEFFRDTEDGAKKTEDALRSMADQLIEVEGIGDVEFEGLSAEDAEEIAARIEQEREQAQGLISDLTELQRAIENQRSATDIVPGTDRNPREELEQREQQLRQELELRGASNDEIDRLIASEEQRLRNADTALEALEAQTEEASDLTSFESFLEEVGFERAQDEEATADAMESQADAIESQAVGLERVQQVMDLMQIETQGAGLSPFVQLLAQVDRTLSAGTEQSLRNVAGTIQMVQNAIENATNEATRERLRDLRDELRGLQEDMKGGADDAASAFDNLGSVVSGSLSSAFEQLGAAIGEGQSAMEALGRAAASILADIARAIGQQLIAQGTAMLVSGNPTGGAYIAAGGAIMAAAGALSAIGGAGRGSSTARGRGSSRESLEGGAVLGGDTEGFYHGGRVRGGQMVETHGLGSREFFVPPMDGAIMTQGQLQQQQNTGPQRVDIQVSGNISGPDLFELETAVRRVADQKDRYQR